PAFKEWHQAFWDNLGTSIQLHHIKKVIAIDHRDCGAARIAYGEAKVANPQVETETHRAALAEFRKQVKERHPQLGVETGLMALDGKLEMFSCPRGRVATARSRYSSPAREPRSLPPASAIPKQPAGTREIDRADGQDDRARPLPKSVIGHPLDDKRRERGAPDRQQDRRSRPPQRQVADTRERAEIERAHDMAE